MANEINVGSVVATFAIRTENALSEADKVLDKLNSFGVRGEQAAARLNRSMENISGFSKYQTQIEKATTAYEKQRQKLQEINQEIQMLRETLPKGVTTDTLIDTKFTAEIDKTKLAMSQYEQEIRKATSAADAYALSQQESAVATAQHKAAVLDNRRSIQDTTLTAYTLSMGLRSLSEVTGGAVADLSGLASQVIYLNQVIRASQTGASAFTAAITGIIGVATIVVSAIMKVVEAHREEVKARREAAQSAIEYIKSSQQEAYTVEAALKVIKDSAATIEEVTAAKNSLAEIFPDIVIGWTDEGNAIIGNNSAIERNIELMREQVRLQREIVVNSQDVIDSQLKEAENTIRIAESRVQAAEANLEWLSTESAFSKDKSSLVYLREQTEGVKELGDARKELAQAQLDSQDAILAKESLVIAQIQTQISGYDTLSAAQKAITDNIIKESIATEDLASITKSTMNEIAKSAIEAANNTQTRIAMEKRLADGIRDTEVALRLSTEAEKERLAVIEGSISSLEGLSGSYAKLRAGEQLSIDNLTKLIDLYPELAQYIVESGDLTLRNGEILKEVANIRQATSEQEIIAEISSLEVQRQAIQRRIENFNTLIETLGNVTLAYRLMYSVEQDTTATEDLDVKITALQAKLKAIQTFDVTTQSNISRSNSSNKTSAQERNEAYQEALKKFEYDKKIQDMTLQNQLIALEEINAQYKKSLDEQRDMDLRLKAARDGIIEDEQRRYEAWIAHKKAMDEDITQLEIENNQKILNDPKSSPEEIWKAEEWLYAQEKQALQDSLDAQTQYFEHRRKLGDDTVAAEIAWSNTILQNDKLTAEQRAEIEEQLYALRIETVNKAMAADERRLTMAKISGLYSIQLEIDMLNDQLRYYQLTDDQIVTILKRRYDLQQQLIEGQQKEQELAFKTAQIAQVDRLNNLKKAWQDWQTSVQKSIQGYLKALDEVEKRESRAEQAAEEQREIDAVRLRIAYENDAYNREQLERNLAELEKERQKRLAEEAKEDARQALNDALQATRDIASERQKALDEEANRLKQLGVGDSLYSSLLGSEGSLLDQVSKSVDITLSAYQSEFQEVGKTLGQSLEEGLRNALDRVLETLSNFQRTQNHLAQDISSTATSAAVGYENRNFSGYYAPVLNFYREIETPYATAKSVEEVGLKLMGGY